MITVEQLLNSILVDSENTLKDHNSCSPTRVEGDLKAMISYYRGIKDALAEGKEEAAPAGNDKMNLVYRWVKVINELAIKAGANINSVNAPTASKAICEIIGMTKAIMQTVGGNNNE